MSVDLLDGLPPATPERIAQARAAAGLTQTQAAALVGAKVLAWQRWEGGQRGMSLDAWALYLLATDQHPTARVIPTR